MELVELLSVVKTAPTSAVDARLSTAARPAGADAGLADARVTARRKKEAKRRANILDSVR
jgi:hypothetical protein